MAGQSRKWMVVVATVWIQAFTGTNLDFASYSSALKAAMGISQMQLNYLATASDLGKALGWSSGLALSFLPLPAVLLLAAAFGLVAYAAQWFIVAGDLSLPYAAVFLLCLLAGCSICWFNTVCFVLCARSFPLNRSLAISLSVSFNGVSAALFALAANAFSPSTSSVYLLLNAVLPLAVSAAALPFIVLCRPADDELLLFLPPGHASRDTHIFLILHILAFITGVYLLLLGPLPATSLASYLILAGALALLALPIAVPRAVIARNWTHGSFTLNVPDAALLSQTSLPDLDLQKPFINGNGTADNWEEVWKWKRWRRRCMNWCYRLMMKGRIEALGVEHTAGQLLRRVDFWLYYLAYFLGATLGLVYSNNLGQIAQSLNLQQQLTQLITVYSACSFFGRLLSAAPDFLYGKVRLARTGWLAAALVPMPVAFFILAYVHDGCALLAGTAVISLSSGFVFTAAVSVTSELFGPSSVGMNHNILISNIPLGSLLYGQIAALVYDANGAVSAMEGGLDKMMVCMGAKCYAATFLVWGCVAMAGLAMSAILYLRTRKAYAAAAEQYRILTAGDDDQRTQLIN